MAPVQIVGCVKIPERSSGRHRAGLPGGRFRLEGRVEVRFEGAIARSCDVCRNQGVGQFDAGQHRQALGPADRGRQRLALGPAIYYPLVRQVTDADDHGVHTRWRKRWLTTKSALAS